MIYQNVTKSEIVFYIRTAKKLGFKKKSKKQVLNEKELKKMVEEKTKIPFKDLFLYLNGKQIKENQNVRIVEGSIIHAIDLRKTSLQKIMVSIKRMGFQQKINSFQISSKMNISEFISICLSPQYSEPAEKIFLVYSGKKLSNSKSFAEEYVENDSQILSLHVEKDRKIFNQQQSKKLVQKFQSVFQILKQQKQSFQKIKIEKPIKANFQMLKAQENFIISSQKKEQTLKNNEKNQIKILKTYLKPNTKHINQTLKLDCVKSNDQSQKIILKQQERFLKLNDQQNLQKFVNQDQIRSQEPKFQFYKPKNYEKFEILGQKNQECSQSNFIQLTNLQLENEDANEFISLNFAQFMKTVSLKDAANIKDQKSFQEFNFKTHKNFKNSISFGKIQIEDTNEDTNEDPRNRKISTKQDVSISQLFGRSLNYSKEQSQIQPLQSNAQWLSKKHVNGVILEHSSSRNSKDQIKDSSIFLFGTQLDPNSRSQADFSFNQLSEESISNSQINSKNIYTQSGINSNKKSLQQEDQTQFTKKYINLEDDHLQTNQIHINHKTHPNYSSENNLGLQCQKLFKLNDGQKFSYNLKVNEPLLSQRNQPKNMIRSFYQISFESIGYQSLENNLKRNELIFDSDNLFTISDSQQFKQNQYDCFIPQGQSFFFQSNNLRQLGMNEQNAQDTQFSAEFHSISLSKEDQKIQQSLDIRENVDQGDLDFNLSFGKNNQP